MEIIIKLLGMYLTCERWNGYKEAEICIEPRIGSTNMIEYNGMILYGYEDMLILKKMGYYMAGIHALVVISYYRILNS